MRRIAGISVASSLVSGAALVLVFAGLGSVAGVTAAAQRTPRIDYDRQVKPVFEKNCLECHSQDKRKGGLSLATYDDILDGGKDGPVVRPGHPATSMLLARVSGDRDGDRMPKEKDPLRAADVALLQRWIGEGARLTPRSPAAPQPWEAPLTLATPAIPAIKWPAWRRPLDRLVATYLSNQGVAQPTLIGDAAFARRAYLDIQTSVAVWSRRSWPTTRNTASTGSRSGMTCCAMKTVRRTSRSRTDARALRAG